uniref:Calcium/sodium antiporter n=1 Tax=candidate division WWE3 bacterium TaxID=2053526 RepID=A0A832E1Z7_UNCKA
MLVNLLILVAAALVLARSSVFLIEKLTVIAVKLRVSEYLVGFVIMAVATSIPEFIVGVIAALENDPNLSLGNVVGSNIVNMSLILGLAALIAGGIRVQIQVRNREILFTDLIGIAPLIMLVDQQLSRTEGFILLAFFFIYMYNLIFQSREYHRAATDHRTGRPLWKELALFGTGMAALLGSAQVLVSASEKLAALLGVPMILFGIFAVALSTSLPELTTSISAALRRQSGFVMGNILGSTVANSTLVLGVTAAIQPFTVSEPSIFWFSAAVLVLTLLVLTFFIRTGYRITRVESLALIIGYIAYLAATELFLR